MENIFFKIIQDDKIQIETVNQALSGYVDDLLHIILGMKGAEIIKIKTHIQTHCEKITPCFVELVQLHLDIGKACDEATITRITANHGLFKNGFNEIMEHSKFGFYQFIYHAWHLVLINIRNEADQVKNKKIHYLSLALLEEISTAYNHADEENKREFKRTD